MRVNILAIGNSFSTDATYYLYRIARAGGVLIKVVNLSIGDCSLEKHWRNIEQNSKLYMYEVNGRSTGQLVSIKNTLKKENWNFVITQQISTDSGIEESYYPYVTNIYNFIKEYAPDAEFLLHQTWAYEKDFNHVNFARYHNDQMEMYEKLSNAYKNTANKLGVRLIPCGDIIQEARTKEPFIYEKGGISLCRDGLHMNYIYGRYLLAAAWYEVLLEKNIMENVFTPETYLAPDEAADPHAINVIKECVHQTCMKVQQ